MGPTSQKYLIFLVLIPLIGITCSSDHATSTEGRRQSRVSGRIVKLYSGAKPDPILCLGEGFQADTVDCSVFYRCLKASNGKFTVYRFQCGPGTIYDPETEICNHPRSTKRSECRGLANDKLITSTEGYMENEIDELHEVNKELPSPISTKSPTVTNAVASTLSWKPDKLESSYITTSYPWFTSSNNVYGENTIISTSSQSHISLSSKIPTDFTTSSTYVTRRPSSLSDTECTSDGFMGDTIDCRKFYRCVNNQRGGFIRYEFSCSETTVWDDDTQGCNHPWAVQRRRCGKGNTYDQNSISHINQFDSNKIPSNKPVQQQTQISYGSEATQSQIQISNGPVIQNQTQINYGDRINQDKQSIKQNQTQISNGSAVSQSQTQINYGDKITQTQVQIDHSHQSSQTQTQVAQFSSTIATTATSTKCTKDGFMADSNDCKKFYRCTSNGRGGFDRHEFSCSEGTLWDKNLEACNHAWAVKDCGEKHTIQNIPPMNSHYTTTSSSFNNEIEDEMGYINQNNMPELEKVTQSPSTLTISTLTTMTTESKQTTELKSYETDCKSSGFFGNANDCSKFHRCVENSGGRFTKYEYKCGDGTLWDPEIESCNHAWTVKHCGNVLKKETTSAPTSTESKIITTVSLIQTTTQKNINNEDYDSGYGSLQRETPPQSTTTTEHTSYEGNVCKTSGFMGDSNDCKKFYQCVENNHGSYTRYEFSCGEGTVWDPEIQACNHASDVEKCGGSSINNNINKITTIYPITDSNSEADNGYFIQNSEEPENSQYTTIRTTTLKSTSSVSNSGNECQTNGFMGDENDCRIFYRCVENGNGGFTRYEFSCGDGTVWDSKISACNHAWAVEKCGGSMTSNEKPSTQGSHPTLTSMQSESSTKTTTHYTPLSSSPTLQSTMSNIDNQCVDNGFMGNKHDCKKFYRCVDDGKGSFTRYEFTCGEGTVWDPKIEACNYAWEVESCGGNASPVTEISSAQNSATQKDEETDNSYATQNNQETGSSTESITWSSSTIKSSTVIDDSKQCQSEGFMGDSNDCSKFYRCVNDGKGSFTRYEFSCGEGTAWDSEINACNHISSVKKSCNSKPTSVTNKPGHDYSSTVTQASTTSTTIDYSSTSQPQKSQQCEQEGFIGDNEDCKKFYRCTDNGQGGYHKYEFNCGEGTVWDQEILACNHASSSRNCSSIHSETQTVTTTGTSTAHSTTWPEQQVTQSTEKTVTSSSKDECASEGFYANSNDCKKFYRCVGDGKGGFTKYDFTCGDGTVWVQEIQACDHDIDNSNCSKNNIGITTSTQPNKEEAVTSTSTSTSSTSTTTDKSSPAKPNDEYDGQNPTNKPISTNDNLCQSEGFYPNRNDCKQFYQCVNNGNGGYDKFEFTCGEGAAWDTNTQSCNHIGDVKNCQNQADIQTKPTIQDEPVSESSSTTEAYSSGSTTTKTSNQDNCEESGYYGNSEDCKKFYRCVDNGKGGFTKYDFTCGDGTIWDQDITACNHPQDVTNPSCKNKDKTSTTTTDSTESSETTTSTKGTSSTDSSTQSTTAESNGNQSTEETTTKKPNNNYTCTEAGFYADPYDCKKFYRCVDWGGDGKTFSIYHFDCGEGTIWDPALQTCNHEDSVYPPRDCSGAQSQNENNKNDTSSTEGTTSKQEETTESSTTEKTSTNTQSTTQGSTESSSTEQSSTTDQTTSTTQHSTTEQTTSQQSTTEKSTTQQSTTEQTTTQQSTTEQSTTQQSTTEQSTTQQSTTEKSTTQQSTTEQSTTKQSTTEQMTSTTTEQTTTTTTEESTTTTAKTTTSESTTTTAEQTTKAEQTTTQESSTEQSSSSTTEQSSTTQETTDGTSTTESGQDTTTEKESSDKECPEIEDDQYLYVCPTGFRRHPKYCNLFYQCTEDDETHEIKVATFNCPNNTIYDESKTQCVEEDKADKKCDGQIAQKRRVKRLDANYKEPITVSRENYSCPTVGHFPFEKNEECSPALFKCEATKTGKLRGFVYQCPEGYVYWAISRKCEPIIAMTDCKRTFINWNSRYEIPVERKNVARIK